MKKLIRQLKFAHAAEIAAYHAYEGHWRSASNDSEQKHIQSIQLDELKHVYVIEQMLYNLGCFPNKTLDYFGKIVGELIGFACYYSGWRLPIWTAKVMEKIGTSSYKEIALEAADLGQVVMAFQLMNMAKIEWEHEQYFENLRKAK